MVRAQLFMLREKFDRKKSELFLIEFLPEHKSMSAHHERRTSFVYVNLRLAHLSKSGAKRMRRIQWANKKWGVHVDFSDRGGGHGHKQM